MSLADFLTHTGNSKYKGLFLTWVCKFESANSNENHREDNKVKIST